MPESTEETVDCLIIGGGINGAGIARDAAGRGLRVLLVEQAGLAQYTSSSSSKLIHGGLRYLQYWKFRLVREALIERERLLTIAPHLVHRQRFVLPHNRHIRPVWMVRLGLFLYDHLAASSTLERSTGLRLRTSSLGAPLKPASTRGFVYSDCTTDDSRLVILNAKAAFECGAAVRCGQRFVRGQREAGLWRVEIEDLGSGQRYWVSARVLINAAGPWVSEVLSERLHCSSQQSVRLVKGSHIVVPRLYEGEQAYVLQNADERIVFVIPYEKEFTLIGTTDVPWSSAPGSADIDATETQYLCDTVNEYFERQIVPSDVVWSYAGLRPLCNDDASNESSVTRDYVLELDAPAQQAPLLSIFGGKITTYRRLAEHALARLEPWLKGKRGAWTDTTPLPGGDIPHSDLQRFVLRVQNAWPFLGAERARRMAHAYGTRIQNILAGLHKIEDMGEDFGAGLTRVEVEYLIREEWASTAEDILWRHSKLGLIVSKKHADRLTEYLSTRV